MTYWKRAFKSITRRKGKSLILFAVLFVLGNVIAGAISIQQATKSVEVGIKRQLGGKATFEFDFNKYSEDGGDMNKIPKGPDLKTIEKAGQSSYVDYYDYNVLSYLSPTKVKAYADQSSKDSNAMVIGGPENRVTLKGTNYAPLVDLKEKKVSLVEGRTFTEEEIKEGKSVGLVSDKFAEENNLHVGDKTVIDNPVYTYSNTGEKSDTSLGTQDLAVEIIGIFKVNKSNKKEGQEKQNSQKDAIKDMMATETLNTIYVPNKVAIEQNKFALNLTGKQEGKSQSEIDESAEQYSPTFLLKSPEDAEAFKQEMQPLMPDYYKVKASTDQYDSIAGPVKSMEKLSRYVLIVAIGASLFIITLVVLLFLRDRKHELGVYLSLGEKRGGVIGQIMIEVLVVALVAITLSVFSGNLLAKSVSSSMLTSQTQVEDTGNMMGSLDEMTSDVGQEDVKDSYQVKLSVSFILIFYVVGTLTVLLSTIVPLVYILRLNPKKIMM